MTIIRITRIGIRMLRMYNPNDYNSNAPNANVYNPNVMYN